MKSEEGELQQADNDDLLDADDDEYADEYETASDLFPFLAAEKCIVDECISLVKQVLHHAEISPSQIQSLAALLLALQRMPLSTPGVAVTVSAIFKFNKESTYCELSVDSDTLILCSGGNAYTPNVGSDNYSTTVFEINSSGHRSDELSNLLEWGPLAGFFESFKELVTGEPEILISDSTDYGKVVWDIPGDPWEQIGNANSTPL